AGCSTAKGDFAFGGSRCRPSGRWRKASCPSASPMTSRSRAMLRKASASNGAMCAAITAISPSKRGAKWRRRSGRNSRYTGSLQRALFWCCPGRRHGRLLTSFFHERHIEIFVELGEPSFHVEWLVHRLQKNPTSNAAHAPFPARQPQFLREAHTLPSSRREKPCRTSLCHGSSR